MEGRQEETFVRDASPVEQNYLLEKKLKEERDQLGDEHAKQLQQVYKRSSFASAWNFVDAYLREEYGAESDV